MGGSCIPAACVGVTCTGATVCIADGGCIPAAQDCTGKSDGAPCDDQDPCTRGDACVGEVCAGSAFTCTPADCQTGSTCDGDGGCELTFKGSGAACADDSNPCTTDLCDSAGGCVHAAVLDGTSCGNGLICSGGVCQGVCIIGGITYDSGTPNPANACQSCQPGVSTSSWSNLTNGSTCDDGDACTSSDQCTGGVCGGTAYTCSPTACQSTSSCDGSGGCSVTDQADGTACATGKVCSGGSCVSKCFINGTLYASGAVNPNNACQVCTPASSTTAWTTKSTGASCATGKVCSGTSCVADCYIGGTLYASGTVDPSNACKVCTPTSSTTAWSNRGTSVTCNDGNACTKSDHCNGSGSCTGTAYSCSPGACESTSTCDGTGGCTTTPAPDGTECAGAPLASYGPKPRLPTCQSVKCQSGVCQFGPGCPIGYSCIQSMCQ